MSEWISVKTALPACTKEYTYDGESWLESDTVIVLAQYGTDTEHGIGVCMDTSEGIYWHGFTYEKELDLQACSVTHWMPLPEPPEVKE